ncbi:MAG: cell division protein FtsA [Alphaproteobacteria bacterium]
MPRYLTKPRSGLVGALDVGSSKVCCFVARADTNGRTRIIGASHQISHGMKNGIVVDIEAAEAAILSAVHAAEQIANETVRSVTVNLSGGHPLSRTVGIEVPIAGHEIGDGDLHRVLEQTVTLNKDTTDRDLIHTIPVGFAIDGDRGIRDPRGMYGDMLGVDMHMITAATGAVRTLETVVQRCHLDVESFVVSAYAAGIAVLVEDELDLGVTLVDMGAGTTSIAVFYEGAVIYADSLPVGGGHVTADIARGLSTPLAHAERLKTLYGSAIASAADEHDIVDVPQMGEDNQETPNPVSRSTLNGIIRPRLEETLELVRSRLDESGVGHFAGRRVVLTGGASQMQGARELAALILDKQVRMGRPLRCRGLAEAMTGPAFATCAGLVGFAVQNPTALPEPTPVLKGELSGLTGRLSQWLREHI